MKPSRKICGETIHTLGKRELCGVVGGTVSLVDLDLDLEMDNAGRVKGGAVKPRPPIDPRVPKKVGENDFGF